MDEVVAHITVHVDTDENRLLVETGSARSEQFTSTVISLPEDAEYWVLDERGEGIEKATSFFHEPRGELWLLSELTDVAEEYQDISSPDDIADVNWWQSPHRHNHSTQRSHDSPTDSVGMLERLRRLLGL